MAPISMPRLPPQWLTAQSGRLTHLVYGFTGRKLGPGDQLALAALNRACAMAEGFYSLVNHGNFICAAPVVRLQLDNGLRVFGLLMTNDPHSTARTILSGGKLHSQKGRNGQRLTDASVAQQLDTILPGLHVKAFYGELSGYIHLSEEAWFRTWQNPDVIEPGARADVRIGDPGAFVSNEEWSNLEARFQHSTDIFTGVIKGWCAFWNRGLPPDSGTAVA